MSHRRISIRESLIAVLFIFTALSPLVAADGEEALSANVLVNWTDDGTGNISHGYIIEFSRALTVDELNGTIIDVEHRDVNSSILQTASFSWGGNDSMTGLNATRYQIILDTAPAWKDEIDITVNVDDGAGGGAITVGSRTVVATLWNEPLSDHEITRVTTWTLNHNTVNGSESQDWDLFFVGQGWQKRTGDLLEANELGTGLLSINESIEGGTIGVMLFLDTVWLNETTLGANLQSQVFEMYGNGSLQIQSSEDGFDTQIYANVVNSYITRAWVLGVIEEQLRLEASGNITMQESGGEDDINITGTLALLLVETHDYNGTRLLENTEFEASANMVISGEDYYMDIDLNELINRERWENGELASSFSRMQGEGTFDFQESEENSTLIVNASVINLESQTENGNTTIDSLHVDGDYSGDVTGDFGIMREIIDTGPQSNATGVTFMVNVIHTESWLNTSAVAGNPFDLEAIHNNTWEYDVPQEHWDNRTIRLKWDSQEGGETSTGDEYPERSPIYQPMETPEAENTIGDVDITRETGVAPANLEVGDTLALLDSELMHLTLTATSTNVLNRDGHIIPVTEWVGTYGEGGDAVGSVVNEGVLSGLLGEVTRNVSIDFEEEGESLDFVETQSLERVISPSMIIASENTPPSIVEVRFQEGAITNENGGLAHIEVEVADPDWNIQSVTADLSSLGLGTIVLNDIGLDGDTIIHDDVFTASLSYLGIISGNVSISVTLTDTFSMVQDNNQSVLVLNRMPRLLDISYSPTAVNRGDTVSVTATAVDTSGMDEVGIDTSGWGGNLTLLSRNGNQFSGVIVIPNGLPPGDVRLPVWLSDNDGGSGHTTMLTIADSSDVFATGETWTEPMPELHILNEGPSVSNVTMWDGETALEVITLPEGGAGAISLVMTAEVFDADTITVVQAKLGMLAPPGEGGTWLTMVDDGTGPDAVAGDGIYSITVEVREGLPEGVAMVEIRGIDVHLAQTGTLDRDFTFDLQNPDIGGGGGEALFEFAGSAFVILIVIGILLLAGAIGAAIIVLRGGGLEDRLDGGDGSGGADLL